MTIERKDTEKMTRVSATTLGDNLLDTLDYLRYKELIADIDVTKNEVDKLAAKLNSRVIQNLRENKIINEKSIIYRQGWYISD